MIDNMIKLKKKTLKKVNVIQQVMSYELRNKQIKK